MIKKETLTVIFTLVVIGITGWLWLSPSGLNSAPDVTFKIIDGRRISLDELHGKTVLVTFWATDCPACIKEMPHFITLYNELSRKGLEIIGVAMAYDPPNRVVELTKHRRVPYPISLDVDGSIARAFDNVMLTPTSFLIGPDGKVLKRKTGEMDMNALRKQLMDLLSQEQMVTSNRQLIADGS